MGLLLTMSQIRAQKDLAFSVTRYVFKLEPLAAELRGYGISLKMALIWQIRQSRLHQDISQSDLLEFNLKLDGRPLSGISVIFVGLIHDNTIRSFTIKKRCLVSFIRS